MLPRAALCVQPESQLMSLHPDEQEGLACVLIRHLFLKFTYKGGDDTTVGSAHLAWAKAWV